MTDQLDKAEAHTVAAIRRMEMMLWFIRHKRLKPERHVPAYFELIANDMVEIQKALLSDDEYTERVAQGLAYVNGTKEYNYDVTADKKGGLHYSVNAVLPLKEMKETVLFARRQSWLVDLTKDRNSL